MSVMTVSAVTALAMQCLPPSLAPIAVGIALHENPRLDTAAVYHNKNGTDDRGLTMINDINLSWLGLTPQTVFEPCANLRASIRVLFARYNGNPPDAVKRAYADGVMSRIRAVDADMDAGNASPSPAKPEVDPDPQPPAWDIEAVADWRRRHDPTPEDAAQANSISEPTTVKETKGE